MRLGAGLCLLLFACAPPGWLQLHAATNLSLLPQSFEPNRGQADRPIEFTSHGPGYSLGLAPGEAVLSLAAVGDAVKPASVRLKVLGADRTIHGQALEAQPSKSNYFIGSNPNLWRRGISHFGRVEYGGIYKGIDLTYYGTGQRLEYDFVVRPHADPRTIRLQFEGADQLRIDENGDLVLKVGKAEIRERKPVAYQDMPEGRVVREVHYVALSTNRIGFEVASYDRAIPLVIDPVLVFSTYFGGTGKDITNRVALDSAGNIYYGGSTSSSNLAGTKIGQPFTGGLNEIGRAHV